MSPGRNMHTRFLMSFSALVLAALGVGMTFLPQELLLHVGARSAGMPVLLIQLLGALYLGFAMLNWMSRGSHMGGIYGRPISMANFLHFAVAALALVRGAIDQPFAPEVTALAAVYSAFGIWFGLVLFIHPADGTRT